MLQMKGTSSGITTVLIYRSSTDSIQCTSTLYYTTQLLKFIRNDNGNKQTSGIGAVRPGILRVGYDGGGP